MAKKLAILFGILIVFVGIGFLVGTFEPAKRHDEQSMGNIRIFQPASGQAVGRPLVIVGQARIFENAFNYRLVDKEGHQLAGSFGIAAASDVGRFGGFSVALEYNYPGFSEAFVEVFTHSAKDGSEIEMVRIPVRLTDRQDTVVKVFFDNEAAKHTDPNSGLVDAQCEGVFPVFRTVPKTTAVAQAALSELFKGPTAAEEQAGYTTALNPGITVRSIKITDDGATVDLSSEILKELGGSCRVSMIKSQINETLGQFNTIHSVNLLVDGKADALQP